MKNRRFKEMLALQFNRFLLLIACLVMGPVLQAEPLDKIVAVVNDNVITANELEQQAMALRHQLQQQQSRMPSQAAFKKQVLDRMINMELQLQLAKSHGMDVAPAELNDAIKNIASRNKISVAQLKKSIAQQGLTWQQYKKDLKQEMLISKLQRESVGQIQVSDSQVNDYLKSNPSSKNYQYHLQDILLPLAEAPSSKVLKATQDKAKALLKQLRSGLDFQKAVSNFSSGEQALKGGDLGMRPLAALPKMFADKVVHMKKGDIAGPIRAPNGLHIIKLFDIKGEQAKQLVQLTHVKHILLKSEPGVSSRQQEAKLENLALQIKRGQSFEAMAKKFSDDVNSAKKGGDIGWLHQGETVPEFEKVYSKLKVGQLSKPVKSGFGWHLIKVVGRKQVDDSKAFEKQQVRQALYQRKFQEAVNNWLTQLRGSSYIKVMG